MLVLAAAGAVTVVQFRDARSRPPMAELRGLTDDTSIWSGNYDYPADRTVIAAVVHRCARRLRGANTDHHATPTRAAAGASHRRRSLGKNDQQCHLGCTGPSRTTASQHAPRQLLTTELNCASAGPDPLSAAPSPRRRNPPGRPLTAPIALVPPPPARARAARARSGARARWYPRERGFAAATERTLPHARTVFQTSRSSGTTPPNLTAVLNAIALGT